MPSIVLITGTSSGIGRLAAETIARAGHIVYATMRDVAARNAGPAQELEKLASDEKLSLRTLEMDVSNADSVDRAVDCVLREQGGLDVVINNAGVMSIGLAEGFTEEQVLDAVNVNFMGPFRVSRAVPPHPLTAQRIDRLRHVDCWTPPVSGLCTLLCKQVCIGGVRRNPAI
ncbi:MAG: oxidoreductase [Bryobacterales bacterium]|nr:oxidoreductase [Bryobacterales bacterium]